MMSVEDTIRVIDAHTHLHDAAYDEDRVAVYTRMRSSGVCAAITIGTDVASSRDACALAERTEGIFATVGLHPHVFNGGVQRDEEWMRDLGADVPEARRRAALEEALAQLHALARRPRVVAVGECGLDYFAHDGTVITDAQRAWQQQGFRAQIALARACNIPVVVHGRGSSRTAMDAYEDIHTIIAQELQVCFVLHCYMGDRAMTERFMALENVIFSFSGNVTYAKKGSGPLDEVLRIVPLYRIMIETDAPYLTPVPHRGKRNECAYVTHVARHIARVRNMPIEDVATMTYATTQSFFGLDLEHE